MRATPEPGRTIKFVALIAGLALLPVGLAVVGNTMEAAGVPVVYALVPKDRLAEAVQGKAEALAIEAAWRKEAMGTPHYPMDLIKTKYSIVVFIENSPAQAIWGRIGIPIQGPRNPRILNVNLSPGYHGTYVIDGGGVVLVKIPPEPKPYQWLEFHSE